ncbi:MAG: O-antigen ligase family protein [Hyphomicrobiaceae bacterium]
MSRLLGAIPTLAFAYVLIVQPVFDRAAPGLLNKQILWPALFALTLLFATICRRELDLDQLKKPPFMLLICFLCFSGASVLWAHSPPDSLKRWIGAIMIVTTIVLPMTLRKPTPDIIVGLFWLYATSIAINAIFVLTTPPMMTDDGHVMGHTGYFYHKQYLGMCASVAILLATHMILSGRRLVASFITICLAAWVMAEAQSRAALGFGIIAVGAAYATLLMSKITKLSVALLVSLIPATFMSLSLVIPNIPERLSSRIYGDPTFSGRTIIWDWVETQAALKPWLGWGFHSFWFVPNSPSFNAPGFVRDMPASHSGYLDMRLETGYFGLLLFLAFIVATLYSLERVRQHHPDWGPPFLSLFIYVLVMNLLETIWFVQYDPLWILFLLLAANAARYEATHFSAVKILEPKKTRAHQFAHSTISPLVNKR